MKLEIKVLDSFQKSDYAELFESFRIDLKSFLREHRRLIEWYLVPVLLFIFYILYSLPEVVSKVIRQTGVGVFILASLAFYFVSALVAVAVLLYRHFASDRNNSQPADEDNIEPAGLSTVNCLSDKFTDTSDSE